MAGPKNVEELNARLLTAFNKILGLGYQPTKGDTFDSMALETLKRELDVKVLDELVWKNDAKWVEPRGKVSKNVFCFDHVFDLVTLVDKPNGSQRWPDCLIIYKKLGLPIEFKRSGNGGIQWNSGLPRFNGIYVYNGQSRDENRVTRDGTTIFLGQSMITPDDALVLTQAAGANSDTAKRFNALLSAKSSMWSLYARQKYDCNARPLLSPARKERETSVLDLIRNLDWETCIFTKGSDPAESFEEDTTTMEDD